MLVKIAKWGNSSGVRIPKPLLESSGMSDNDVVEIIAEDKKLIIKSAREPVTLEKIFSGWNDTLPEHYDWGALDTPKGREVL